MPIKQDREYRTLAAPLSAQAAAKRIDTDFYVEGYATTFESPYLLYEIEGTKFYERIDAHALDGADMSDVIMQYDHEGRVFARQSNGSLILIPDHKGLFSALARMFLMVHTPHCHSSHKQNIPHSYLHMPLHF